MKKSFFFYLKGPKLKTLLSACFLILTVVFINTYYFSSYFTSQSTETSGNAFNKEQEAAGKTTGGNLAIVIDYFGLGRDGMKRIMSIDRHLTFSIMPFQNLTKTDAILAHEKGYEVMVHLPLDYKNSSPVIMVNDEIYQTAVSSIIDVPYAVGANLDTKGIIRGDKQVFPDIFDALRQKNIFFLDNNTKKQPEIEKIARLKGVKYHMASIMLNEKKSKEHIKKQLIKAGEAALEKGNAIAVGHVGYEGSDAFAEAIIEMLPEFDKKNIRLVFVSELEN